MTKIAVVSAGLGDPSTTRMLADAFAAKVNELAPATAVEVCGLRDLAHDIVDATLAGFASPRLQSVIESVQQADGVIVVSPIYQASYSGLFKSFFDAFENDSLIGKPVLTAATGGTARHSLAIEYALKPMFSYLQTVLVPTGVFASPHDWGSNGERALDTRIERAVRELLSLVEGHGTGRSFDDSIDLFSETMLSISDPFS